MKNMNIGIVIITHGNIGHEMTKVVETITNEKSGFICVSVDHNSPLEFISKNIHAAIEQVKTTEGVLVLTDIFGATPCNECVPLLSNKDIQIVAGVNLPMLMKIATHMLPSNLLEAAHFIQNYGKNNILDVRDLCQKVGK